MVRFKLLISIFISLVLTACGGGGGGSGGGGGGGGGGSTNITATPTSLSFTAVERSATADTKTVNATFKGDGLVIGYPIGVPAESWLTVNTANFSSSPVSAQFIASAAGLSNGTYTTTVRLVTGNADGSDIKYVDIPITFVVTAGLSSNTSSLQFGMMEASNPPASQTINVHSDTKPANWRLTVQYSGTTSDWLTLGATTGTIADSDASVSITAKELPLGDYSANILLSDINGQVRDEIPVHYSVNAGFSISGETTKTITAQSNIEDLTWQLNLQSQFDFSLDSNLQWKIESDKPWLTAVNSSGNFALTKHIQLKLLPEQLSLLDDGSYDAVLTFSVPNSTITPRNIPVHISQTLQPTLTITDADGAPVNASYLINNSSTDADLTKSFKVVSTAGTAFNGLVNWTATSGDPRIAVLSTTGDTNTHSTLQIKIYKDELAQMLNGNYNASVNLSADNPHYKVSLINVAINLQLAQIEHVAPYLAYTSRSEPVVIRGSGFANQPAMKINIGGNLIDATVVNDTEIHINYPSLTSEQRINLTIQNNMQLVRGGADLVFKNPPTYSAQKIPLTKYYHSTMTLDPERQAILLSDRYSSGEISRLRLTTNGWEIDSYSAPSANSATVSLDGKELLVTLAAQNIADSIVHLDPNTLAFKSATNFPNDFNERYDTVAPLNDGRTLVIDSDQSANALSYPSLETFNLPNWWFSNVDIILSRDRSFMLLGDRNQTYSIYSFDVNSSTFTPQIFDVDFLFQTTRISMSGDAARIVAGTNVYSREFALLGTLAQTNRPQFAAVTPNGKYVYVANTNDINSTAYTFNRYDISAANGPYAVDTNDIGVTLDTGDVPVTMKVSDDGKALFVLAAHVEFSTNTAAYLYVFPISN